MKKRIFIGIIAVIMVVVGFCVIYFLKQESETANQIEELVESSSETFIALDSEVIEPAFESTVEPIKESTQYTYIEINKALWTIDDTPIYSDVEGTDEVDNIPSITLVNVERQCSETGLYEIIVGDIGNHYYAEPDFFVEEMPDVAEQNPQPSEVQSTPPQPSEPQPETGDKNILEPVPEGDYVPSTYEEGGYTFTDLGYMIISFDGTKIIYSDLEMKNPIGEETPWTIGIRQCHETGAIEIFMGETETTAWISGDGVRMGL